MSRRRFEMYQYRHVLVRLRQGDSDRDIARAKLMGRRKLQGFRALAEERGWLAPEVALPEDAELAAALKRPPARTCVSTLEPLRAAITQWFDSGIQGTTMLGALRRNHGYTGSYSALRRFLQALAASRPPPSTTRLDFAAGEAAQVDFGAGPKLLDPATGLMVKTWVFVMTLCWSRHQYAELVRDQKVATWLACHRRAFEAFGGVPARIIIDNASCAITRACTTDPTVQRSYADCAEGYGFRISACPPADPQKKGIVEAGVKYIKRAFLPLRELRDLTDANRQLHDWTLGEAGTRCHGTTRQQPLAQFAIERPLLAPLPAIAPQLAVWSTASVHRDAHVQFEYSLYSVPFRLIGQKLWLRATAGTLQCFREHELVATHARLPRPGMRSTVRDHLPPDAPAFAMADPQWCLSQAERIGPSCSELIRRLFADRVLDNLRAAQGVIRLAHKHGKPRLEAACARALAFDAPRYRTVKTILDKGLDVEHESAAFDRLAETYTRGGRFCRDPLGAKPH